MPFNARCAAGGRCYSNVMTMWETRQNVITKVTLSTVQYGCRGGDVALIGPLF